MITTAAKAPTAITAWTTTWTTSWTTSFSAPFEGTSLASAAVASIPTKPAAFAAGTAVAAAIPASPAKAASLGVGELAQYKQDRKGGNRQATTPKTRVFFHGDTYLMGG